MTKPVWLLDIDGVLNAVDYPTSTLRFKTWPQDTWLNARIMKFPMSVATAVRDFIRSSHESGLVDIRWHTTSWQDDVERITEWLDLPDFPVHRATNQHGWDRTWWKLPSALSVVHLEHRPLIWTDDDLNYELPPRQKKRLQEDGALLICPKTEVGLSPAELRRINKFLVDSAALAATVPES